MRKALKLGLIHSKFEQKRAHSPDEVRLARAIIQGALRDITLNVQNPKASIYDPGNAAKFHALWWILDDLPETWEEDDDGLGSYVWCCKTLGWEPRELRDMIEIGDWDGLQKAAGVPLH